MTKNAKNVGQRFEINDRVTKKIISATKSFPRKKGKIVAVEIDKDTRGRPLIYYQVQWDTLKSPAKHAQHVLQAEES